MCSALRVCFALPLCASAHRYLLLCLVLGEFFCTRSPCTKNALREISACRRDQLTDNRGNQELLPTVVRLWHRCCHIRQTESNCFSAVRNWTEPGARCIGQVQLSSRRNCREEFTMEGPL